MKVYVVTTGQYSDYHLEGVYSTMEKAEAANVLYDGEIVEYEMDDMPECPPGLLPWHVVIDADGNASAERESISYFKPCDLKPYGDQEKKKAYCEVFATDASHAIKIANEKRIQAIATGTWETDWDAWKTRQVKPK